MTNDILTNDQKINLDYLNEFYKSKSKVHIRLLRTDNSGNNIFFNCVIKEKLSETMFIINDRILGDIKISLFEIKENGVSEFRGDNNGKY